MKITFVGIGWEQLGLSLLSAMAKGRGHKTSLAFSAALFNDRYNLQVPFLAKFFDDRKEILEQIRSQDPDVLALSPLTATYQWMLGIAKDAKEILPRIKTVFGGVHVSAVPEHAVAQPQVDYVCVGEGDLAFAEILDAVEHGLEKPIPNTWSRTSGGEIVRGPRLGFLQDLDSLPMFDKLLWEEVMPLRDIYFTMASRGCPSKCSFCFNSFFAQLPGENPGRYVRHRSPEHLLRELRFAKDRYDPRTIEFEDDVFTLNKPWLKRFLELYRLEIRRPFQCMTNSRYVDEDVAGWLAGSGCRYVQMGVQSMDDEYKKNFLNRNETSFEIETALGLFKKYSIHVKVDHMLGLPQEPLSAQKKALALYARHRPYRIQTFWVNYFPGTALFKQALDKGFLSVQNILDVSSGNVHDFFRDSATRTHSPGNHRFYKGYELVFKMIPMVPQGLMRLMPFGFLRKMPQGLSSFLSFVFDAAGGLIKRNPDHLAYAGHYLRHMQKALLRKMGLSFFAKKSSRTNELSVRVLSIRS